MKMSFGTVTSTLSLCFLICLTVTCAQFEECFYNFTEPKGRIYIPESNDIISSRDNISLCTWVVSGPSDAVIEFDLEIVDVPGNSTQLVFGVGWEPWNSTTEYATFQPAVTRLHRQPHKVVVPHDTAWVQLRGDIDTDNMTVVLTYKITPRVVCDSPVHQTALRGELTSIDYPGEYPINGECTWRFEIPQGHMIELTFHDFDLQDDSDFLLIGDGTEVLQGVFTPYTGRLEKSPYMVSFSYSHVWLLFISNHLRDEMTHSGFNISYVIKPKDSENEIPRIQTIAIPKPTGEPFVEKIQLTISGITKEKMQGELELFKASIAGFVTAYCKHIKSICGTQAKQISAKDVNISDIREDGTSVDVELTLGSDFPANMAAISSLHLDKLSEANTRTQETEPILPMHSSSNGSPDTIPLPRWLIGVIAVVAFLVVIFFALIVYSLLKDRKKPEKAQDDGGSEASSEERESRKDSSAKRSAKKDIETPAKVETVSEITPVVDVPNGKTPKKTSDAEESKSGTSERLVDDTQKRADPEGKSDVNVIEPLQLESTESAEAETDPGPSSSSSTENEPKPASSETSDSTDICPDMNIVNSENSTPVDPADECPTPEHDLSTDL